MHSATVSCGQIPHALSRRCISFLLVTFCPAQQQQLHECVKTPCATCRVVLLTLLTPTARRHLHDSHVKLTELRCAGRSLTARRRAVCGGLDRQTDGHTQAQAELGIGAGIARCQREQAGKLARLIVVGHFLWCARTTMAMDRTADFRAALQTQRSYQVCVPSHSAKCCVRTAVGCGCLLRAHSCGLWLSSACAQLWVVAVFCVRTAVRCGCLLRAHSCGLWLSSACAQLWVVTVFCVRTSVGCDCLVGVV
jgi:hypothetical protein